MSELLGILAGCIGVAIAFWVEVTLNKRRVEPPVIMNIEWEFQNLDMRKFSIHKTIFLKELYECLERRIKIELKRYPYRDKTIEIMVREQGGFSRPSKDDILMAFLILGVDFKSVKGRKFWQLTKD